MIRIAIEKLMLGRPILLLVFLMLSGCRPFFINGISDRIHPSNDRTWSPELNVLPNAVVEDGKIRVRNIRNVNYLSDDDFVVRHYDRTIDLEEVQSVDFIVTPFNNAPALAHTMLSFGLTDGTYIGLSVEIRNEQGEEYSPLLGISNQFEITYVVADERDLIRLRTKHRDSDVFVYPSVATPKQSQELFVDVMDRVNRLEQSPEFYNTIRNNCTTNLVDHVNRLNPDRVAFGWRVLLPGFSDKYAYDLGLLDNRIPFEDLKTVAYVSDLAEKYYDAPDFSKKIRSRRRNIERLAAHQLERQPTLNGSGEQLLDSEFPRSSTIWR